MCAGRIQGDAGSLGEALHDVYDAGAAKLATQTDSLFTRSIDTFKDMAPHLKARPPCMRFSFHAAVQGCTCLIT